jgi:hypothetical protein
LITVIESDIIYTIFVHEQIQAQKATVFLKFLILFLDARTFNRVKR